MKNKILILSIIVIISLVCLPFNSVLGHKSNISNIKESPLFKIRTDKAIGRQAKVLHCEYKSEDISIPNLHRIENLNMIQKIIDRISAMDYRTFDNFIDYIIDSAKKNKKLNDLDSDNIREAISLLRNSRKSTFFILRDSLFFESEYRFREFFVNTFSEPFCFIKNILVFIVRIMLKIYCEISGPPVGTVLVCPPLTVQ